MHKLFAKIESAKYSIVYSPFKTLKPERVLELGLPKSNKLFKLVPVAILESG
ncbi:Uncharacterised protein [uncultured archaeon]|nr:Uncharacterised protein [uncultured archaeon]